MAAMVPVVWPASTGACTLDRSLNMTSWPPAVVMKIIYRYLQPSPLNRVEPVSGQSI
jgi:hypothetical protein